MYHSLEKYLPWVATDDPAENYHTASKLSRWVSGSYSAPYAYELANDPQALSSFGLPTSVLTGNDHIALPEINRPTPVGEVLRTRRSAQRFQSQEVLFKDLAKILSEAACVSSEHGRGAPSAGALYPIDIYLCVVDVAGLAPGFYGLDPFAARLNKLRISTDPRAFLKETLVFQNLAEGSAFHVFFIASFTRQRVKYGQRAYRFALLEAGHLAQAMFMVAQELGIASCPVGGFIDAVDELLCLDGVEQSVLYSAAFGYADTSSLSGLGQAS